MNLAGIPSDLLPEICRQIPHFVWIARPDGFIEYVNQYGLNYLGVTMDELRGWNWMQIVHPADREMTMHGWLDALAHGQPYDGKYRMVTAHGHFRWNLVRARPVSNVPGRVAAYVGTCTDVDEWKQSLRNLSSANREIEQLLALLNIYESKAPIGLGFLDRELRYVRLNETLARSNGVSVSGHLGQRVRDVIPKLWPNLGPILERVVDTRCAAVNIEVAGETNANPNETRMWRASYYPVLHADEFLGVALLVIELNDSGDLKLTLEEIHPEVEGRCQSISTFPNSPYSAA